MHLDFGPHFLNWIQEWGVGGKVHALIPAGRNQFLYFIALMDSSIVHYQVAATQPVGVQHIHYLRQELQVMVGSCTNAAIDSVNSRLRHHQLSLLL